MSKKLTREEKYQLYEASVQNPETDIKFINREFKKIRGRDPKILREDFSGTGQMACAWVKSGKDVRQNKTFQDISARMKACGNGVKFNKARP